MSCKAAAVHKTRLRLGEGLVGRVARTGRHVNTANAPAEPGFRFMPETGEEVYSSFLGVPIQRVGDKLGVLVVQSREARQFTPREFRIVAAPQVIELLLDEESQHLAGLSDFIGKPISLQSEPAMGQGQFDIVLL